MNQLRITYISQTLGMGGAEIFISELLAELQKRHQITAYTNYRQFQNQLRSHAIVAGDIPVVIDIIGNWKGLFKAAVLLPYAWLVYGAIVFRVRDAGVILISGFAEKLFVSFWAWLFRVPVVWIEFSPLTTLFEKFFGFPRVWYWLAACFPAKVITTSRHSQFGLLKEGILTKQQLVRIPCGRNIAVPARSGIIKQQEVVCISRMEEGKGQDILVQIFALVHKKLPSAHMTLVGEGAFLTSVKKQIRTLQLTKVIACLGRVPDALAILQKARICAVPSIWPLEGFGLVACEGLALAKPVVAFDHAPINEIVTHERNALLAPDGDLEKFADNIIRLLTDDNLATRLGRSGAKEFQSFYTIEQVAKKYELLLQDHVKK
ncbi:MAG: hypothetical protein COU67_04520 [Candidatus Pacebacteria bacterium CG10_big_fil_rev_8_21_14_0_10_44_54]|nr:MAG: hypothetical protein COU67_04520 [Candidatus Pacebacteria bacterium CG10_big_fil_rev_8_21_14_0_10_44_54]